MSQFRKAVPAMACWWAGWAPRSGCAAGPGPEQPGLRCSKVRQNPTKGVPRRLAFRRAVFHCPCVFDGAQGLPRSILTRGPRTVLDWGTCHWRSEPCTVSGLLGLHKL